MIRVVLRGVGRHLRVGPEVGARGALVARADAVAPVVAVGEAAAGPAEDRRLDGFRRSDERRADTEGVRDLRVFADPDAVVDDSAEVLDEVAVDLGRDGADGLSGRTSMRASGLRGPIAARAPQRPLLRPVSAGIRGGLVSCAQHNMTRHGGLPRVPRSHGEFQPRRHGEGGG